MPRRADPDSKGKGRKARVGRIGAKTAPPLRLVVAGANAPALLAEIKRQFPRIEAAACQTGDELDRIVDTLRPNVAFAFRTAGIEERHWRHLLGAKSIDWVHLGNIGFDHVPKWNRKKVTVSNSGGAAADAMAEYVIGAMTLVNTGFIAILNNQRRTAWERSPWEPLRGKTLVALGAGEIGRRVIAKARALGMRIIAVRNSAKPAPGAHETLPARRLHDALARADFVSIQVPLNKQTEHLIDAKALARLRPTAWLINVARGAVIDEAALTEAARERRIGGAVLDVFQVEPLPPDSELWRLSNIVVTPHMSGQVPGFYGEALAIFYANLRRFKAGRPLRNVV